MLEEEATDINTSKISRFCYIVAVEPCPNDDCSMINTLITILEKIWQNKNLLKVLKEPYFKLEVIFQIGNTTQKYIESQTCTICRMQFFFTMAYNFLSLQCYTTTRFINDDKIFEPVRNWQQNQWAMNSTFKIKVVFGCVNCQHTWACTSTMNLSLVMILQATTTPIGIQIFKKKIVTFYNLMTIIHKQ